MCTNINKDIVALRAHKRNENGEHFDSSFYLGNERFQFSV